MPTSRDEARQKVAELVKKYQSLSPSAIKKIDEANTKQAFIEPLFRALGWDVDNTDEVTLEENVSNKRVDYAFKLNGVSQFYLEAKPLKADLTNPDYIKQAVTYAYSKSITWAVLTDFEKITAYESQTGKPFLNLSCADFLTDFDELWLFSKESFQNNALSAKAEKYGILPLKIGIEQKLFRQLRQWRGELLNQLPLYNEKLTLKQSDEVIQKLFDRLIFIRTAEDRGIEDKRLRSAVNQWKAAGRKGELVEELRPIFREFDGYYDSDLFSRHPADDVFIMGTTLESIIEGLYEVPGGIASYDFSIIDADVLGAVYEQYLGYVGQVEKDRAKAAQAKMDLGRQTENISLTAKKERRKEQGIYYTPKFVTDYIVKETVGRYLAEHTPAEVRNIKILDPACGSGSFLIRAFDELLRYYANQKTSKLEKDIDAADRISMLKTNIFGVDLDIQAVEIARLNLLLRSLAKRDLLPSLVDNVRQGNSLISGTEEELERYFGNGWEEKKPFNWNEEFKDIMDRGGFDVVIGNPPYVRQEQLSESKPWLQKQYECYTSTADIYVYFLERGLKLLKDGGLLAFITSNKYFRAAYGEKLRRFLSSRARILSLIDFGDAPVFEATAYPSIIVLQKLPAKDNKTRVFTWNRTTPVEAFASKLETESFSVPQEDLSADGWRLESNAALRLLEKLRKAGKPLGEYVNGRFYRGIITGLNEAFVVDSVTRDRLITEHPSSAELLKPFLRGRDVKRWSVNFAEQYLIKIESSENRTHPWSNKPLKEAERVFAETYPAIYERFKKYKQSLVARDDQGTYYWELRSCTYWAEFERPKIAYPNICKRNEFAWDDNGYYINQKAFIIPDGSKYLLGILNSNVVTWLFDKILAKLQNGYYEPSAIFMKDFPIPIATEPKTIERLIDKILSSKAKDQEVDVSGIERQIDNLVYALYGLNEKERQIIEASVTGGKKK